MSFRKTLPLVVPFLACSATAEAQNTRLEDANEIGWYSISLNHKLSRKWSAQLEYHWRRARLITDWQQSLFRPSINYQVTPKLLLQAAYGWAVTYSYGEYPVNSFGKTFPEHRIVEQAQVTEEVGRVTLTHRLRLEQRWIGKYNSTTSEKPESYTYLNRTRYMLRLQCPLQGPSLDDREFYAAAYDELFIGFGKNVGENVFDQNRVALMAGYRFSRHLRVEGGYFNQVLQLGREVNNRNVFQANRGIILNVLVNTGN